MRVSQEESENFSLHELLLMMISGLVGEELSAMESVMHVCFIPTLLSDFPFFSLTSYWCMRCVDSVSLPTLFQ